MSLLKVTCQACGETDQVSDDANHDTAGIDEQPGYNQILAIDSEGNLVNFSDYLEY